ncbi:MAG: hypothetical protein IPM39_01335 [Chloroflexi bacterium]|nr:hypothetical protein [Chloroflexota bacterium]
MSRLNSERLLGAALIVGGVLVGVVVAAVLRSYTQDGMMTGGTAVTAAIIAFLLLVLPQLALGISLIRHTSPPNDP